MKLLRRACSFVLAAVLFAVLLPVVPASARPLTASRPLRASLAQKAFVRTLAADDDFPGVTLPASPFTDSVAEPGDPVDVFKIDLAVGQSLEVTITGPTGSGIVGELYNGTDWETGYLTSTWGPDAEGMGYPQTLTYTAGTAGAFYLAIWPYDGDGPYTCTWSVVDPPISMKRVAGATRYLTNIATSKEWADGSSPAVIVARADNFADALAASALAGSYDCPILLTAPKTLSPGLMAEIDRLRGTAPGKVFIVGSDKAVFPAVATELAKNTSLTIKRLGGLTRFDTAAAIGAELKAHEPTWTGDAWIVKGGDFPDALAAAPIAAHRKMPILLVTPTSIPLATKNAITSLGITHAYVTGSNLAINDYVASHLGVTATRIEGPKGSGRYGTAAAIAKTAVDNGWASASTVGIATGADFPDALGGAALIGHNGGVLLLADPSDYRHSPFTQWPAWAMWVSDHQGSITAMRAFGSNKAVSDWLFGHFLWAMQP